MSDRRARVLVLLLTALVVGACAPARVSPVPQTASVQLSSEPATVLSPVSETESGASGRLVASKADTPPIIDGHIDDVWTQPSLQPLQLTWRKGSPDVAQDMSVRALLVGESIYFLVRWTGAPPDHEEQITSNRVTLHLRIPEDIAETKRLDCNVVCHTAFSDADGRIAYANAETIPSGGSETLPVAGGWQDGAWIVEWSRPLVNENPFDLQFTDLDRAYLFMVKVFGPGSDVVDPVSEKYHLEFAQ